MRWTKAIRRTSTKALTVRMERATRCPIRVGSVRASFTMSSTTPPLDTITRSARTSSQVRMGARLPRDSFVYRAREPAEISSPYPGSVTAGTLASSLDQGPLSLRASSVWRRPTSFGTIQRPSKGHTSCAGSADDGEHSARIASPLERPGDRAIGFDFDPNDRAAWPGASWSIDDQRAIKHYGHHPGRRQRWRDDNPSNQSNLRRDRAIFPRSATFGSDD